MGNRLFFVNPDQKVQEMNEVNMKDMLESKLQEIVEKNPDLLSRAWDDQPRRLFLVQREQEVTAAEDEGNAFSLDHLLVDSEGVPVLVEVKRSTDTRIRREVAAQMLDYACRASGWSIERLKECFRRNNALRPDAETFFDDEEFWNRVSANLEAEHFRLVFVADRIPETLRILIEFMDRAMNNIEVYGVELKPYRTADGAMLLSSNIIGNSLAIRAKPTYQTRQTTSWTQETFMERVQNTMGGKAVEIAGSLIHLCDEFKLDPVYGKGAKVATFNPKRDGKMVFCLGQDDSGAFVVEFDKGHLAAFSCGFEEMISRLKSIWNGNPPDGFKYGNYYVRVNLNLLSDPSVYEEIKGIITELLDRSHTI